MRDSILKNLFTVTRVSSVVVGAFGFLILVGEIIAGAPYQLEIVLYSILCVVYTASLFIISNRLLKKGVVKIFVVQLLFVPVAVLLLITAVHGVMFGQYTKSLGGAVGFMLMLSFGIFKLCMKRPHSTFQL
jgi:hypothetical protein